MQTFLKNEQNREFGLTSKEVKENPIETNYKLAKKYNRYESDLGNNSKYDLISEKFVFKYKNKDLKHLKLYNSIVDFMINISDTLLAKIIKLPKFKFHGKNIKNKKTLIEYYQQYNLSLEDIWNKQASKIFKKQIEKYQASITLSFKFSEFIFKDIKYRYKFYKSTGNIIKSKFIIEGFTFPTVYANIEYAENIKFNALINLKHPVLIKNNKMLTFKTPINLISTNLKRARYFDNIQSAKKCLSKCFLKIYNKKHYNTLLYNRAYTNLDYKFNNKLTKVLAEPSKATIKYKQALWLNETAKCSVVPKILKNKLILSIAYTPDIYAQKIQIINYTISLPKIFKLWKKLTKLNKAEYSHNKKTYHNLRRTIQNELLYNLREFLPTDISEISTIGLLHEDFKKLSIDSKFKLLNQLGINFKGISGNSAFKFKTYLILIDEFIKSLARICRDRGIKMSYVAHFDALHMCHFCGSSIHENDKGLCPVCTTSMLARVLRFPDFNRQTREFLEINIKYGDFIASSVLLSNVDRSIQTLAIIGTRDWTLSSFTGLLTKGQIRSNLLNKSLSSIKVGNCNKWLNTIKTKQKVDSIIIEDNASINKISEALLDISENNLFENIQQNSSKGPWESYVNNCVLPQINALKFFDDAYDKIDLLLDDKDIQVLNSFNNKENQLIGKYNTQIRQIYNFDKISRTYVEDFPDSIVKIAHKQALDNNPISIKFAENFNCSNTSLIQFLLDIEIITQYSKCIPTSYDQNYIEICNNLILMLYCFNEKYYQILDTLYLGEVTLDDLLLFNQNKGRFYKIYSHLIDYKNKTANINETIFISECIRQIPKATYIERHYNTFTEFCDYYTYLFGIDINFSLINDKLVFWYTYFNCNNSFINISDIDDLNKNLNYRINPNLNLENYLAASLTAKLEQSQKFNTVASFQTIDLTNSANTYVLGPCAYHNNSNNIKNNSETKTNLNFKTKDKINFNTAISDLITLATQDTDLQTNILLQLGLQKTNSNKEYTKLKKLIYKNLSSINLRVGKFESYILNNSISKFKRLDLICPEIQGLWHPNKLNLLGRPSAYTYKHFDYRISPIVQESKKENQIALHLCKVLSNSKLVQFIYSNQYKLREILYSVDNQQFSKNKNKLYVTFLEKLFKFSKKDLYEILGNINTRKDLFAMIKRIAYMPFSKLVYLPNSQSISTYLSNYNYDQINDLYNKNLEKAKTGIKLNERIYLNTLNAERNFYKAKTLKEKFRIGKTYKKNINQLSQSKAILNINLKTVRHSKRINKLHKCIKNQYINQLKKYLPDIKKNKLLINLLRHLNTSYTDRNNYFPKDMTFINYFKIFNNFIEIFKLINYNLYRLNVNRSKYYSTREYNNRFYYNMDHVEFKEMIDSDYLDTKVDIYFNIIEKFKDLCYASDEDNPIINDLLNYRYTGTIETDPFFYEKENYIDNSKMYIRAHLKAIHQEFMLPVIKYFKFVFFVLIADADSLYSKILDNHLKHITSKDYKLNLAMLPKYYKCMAVQEDLEAFMEDIYKNPIIFSVFTSIKEDICDIYK